MTGARTRDGERVRSYGIALAAILTAALLTALLHGWLEHTVYLFFYPAAMLSAWFAGRGAGLFAAVVGAFSATYLFLEPVGSLKVSHPSTLATAAMLAGTAWLIDELRGRLDGSRAEALARAVEAESLARTSEEQAVELEMQIDDNQALLRDLEESNARLSHAVTEAQAASRAKSAFLATMSHELRTPLNAIDGYAELIEMEIYGAITPEQAQAIARIRSSHDLLLGLVDQVLDQARIEAGTLALATDAVPLADVVDSACASLGSQARAKELDLSRDPVPDGIAARGDRQRIEQILLNLVGNSVKFTPRGGRIRIGCAMEGDRVLVRVRDTGEGIPPEMLDSVFQPFFQVDQSSTRAQGGAGLGLSISRDLARAMGGDISVTSEVGRGSTFTLWLRPAVGAGTPTRV